MNIKIRVAALVAAGTLAFALASCGGGGGGYGSSMAPNPTASVSTGAITAFGSVFVNGHEFNTSGARVVDDDTGATAMNTANLEVGMVVTVNSAAGSTTAAPVAADIHVSPLARGFVDASDTTAGTITVMGQVVQLTSSTAFSDHRACIAASTCATPTLTGQGDLVVGTSFVTIHGYLTAAGSSAQIVATLVSAQDYAANTSRFKVEGIATVSGTTVSVGAETLDLSHALCYPGGTAAQCANFKTGDVIAAIGTTAPASGVFAADKARLSRLLPQAAGASVEVEGLVSSVDTMNKSFVVRGITIDGSALMTLPAVGDRVEVLGTVGTDLKSVVATSIEHDIPAAAARIILAGPLSGVAAGPSSGTFNVTVLGQTATVSADTHIADRTAAMPTTFNITNFDTYLNSLPTPFVVVRTLVDASGNLQATGFDVVAAPPGGLVGIAGPADAAPTTGTTTSTLTIHGVTVTYDPALTLPRGNTNIVAGDYILAAGALSSGGIDTTATNGFLFVLPPSAKDRGFHGFR